MSASEKVVLATEPHASGPMLANAPKFARILSQALKPDAKDGKPQAAEPEKSDAKPIEAKQ